MSEKKEAASSGSKSTQQLIIHKIARHRQQKQQQKQQQKIRVPPSKSFHFSRQRFRTRFVVLGFWLGENIPLIIVKIARKSG